MPELVKLPERTLPSTVISEVFSRLFLVSRLPEIVVIPVLDKVSALTEPLTPRVPEEVMLPAAFKSPKTLTEAVFSSEFSCALFFTVRAPLVMNTSPLPVIEPAEKVLSAGPVVFKTAFAARFNVEFMFAPSPKVSIFAT